MQLAVLDRDVTAPPASPADGARYIIAYLFGATLLYKVNASTSVRMRGRLVLNGMTEIRGSFGEVSGAHVSLATRSPTSASTDEAEFDIRDLRSLVDCIRWCDEPRCRRPFA